MISQLLFLLPPPFLSLSLFVPKVYLEPLKKPQAFGMIDSSLVRDIFYQIPEICGLHERFLLQISQRTERWHPLQKIGDVFVNTVSDSHWPAFLARFPVNIISSVSFCSSLSLHVTWNQY